LPYAGATCPVCQPRKAELARVRRNASGRHRAHWRRVRVETLERDGWRCRRCGGPANTVHLDPRLRNHHDLATPKDCVSLCASCHGRLDGARA